MINKNIYNIKTKLIIMVSIIIVSMILLLVSIFYSYTNQFLGRRMADISKENLTKISESINAYIEEAYYIASRLQSDPKFIESLYDEAVIQRWISEESKNNTLIDSIYVYTQATQSIITSNSINSKIHYEDYKTLPWIKDVMGKGINSQVFSIIGYEDTIGLFNQAYIAISKPIYNDLEEFIGILCINIREKKIYDELLSNIIRDEDSDYYFVSQDDLVISSNQNESMYKSIEEQAYYLNINSFDEGYFIIDDSLYVFISNHFPQYKMINRMDSKMISSGLSILRTIAVLLSLVAIGISIIALNYISNHFYKPIFTLKKSMKGFASGDFEVRINERRKDEFSLLYHGFNNMADGVNQLMDQTVEQKIKINEAKFKILQTQISPHFIYNTLHSIKCVAMIQKDKVISEMLTSFIELLQLSSDNRKDLIPLSEEIRQVNNYIKLQKRRYGDAFEVMINIDQEHHTKLVPKLILQPLIENSIKYGINFIEGNGLITINAQEVSLGLAIDITDGCTNPDIDKIINILQTEGDPNYREIGINNVNKRIKIIYGDAYGLSYYPDEVGGLKVRVLLGFTPLMNYDKIGGAYE